MDRRGTYGSPERQVSKKKSSLSSSIGVNIQVVFHFHLLKTGEKFCEVGKKSFPGSFSPAKMFQMGKKTQTAQFFLSLF